jgi:two-component system phosphate regulon sensor histidine kinase PhoR
MFSSVRFKIAFPFVLLFTLIFGGFRIYLLDFVQQTYLNDLESKLISQARLISDQLNTLNMPWMGSTELDQQARRWADILENRVTVIDQDGIVVGESHDDRTEMDNHLNRPEIVQAAREGMGSSMRFSSSVGYQMMYVAVPVRKGNEIVGYARVALPLNRVEKNIKSLQGSLTLAMVGAIGIAVILAFWIAENTTRPMRELTRAAQKIAGSDPEFTPPARMITASRDEIGQLTRSFNVMTNQLNSKIDALITEKSKMTAVLEKMTDGVLIIDHQGAVRLINPAAQRMFNIQLEQAINRSLAEVLRHHQLVDLWERCIKSGESQIVTLDLGIARLYLQGEATPLGEALPGSTLLLFQDLTRLRHLETVRRDFISNISHELRTPLATLKALVETLQESIFDDPPATKRFLEKMETEVDALNLMVSELLELSRIESGKVPLTFSPTDPQIMLNAAIERLRLQAERGNLSIETNLPDKLPPVLADENRIEQVIVNLLHNSIKFTPPGGHIWLSARVDDRASQTPQVVFSVKDNGVGIPSDDLPRIFERFFKADRARSGGGTGLGLAISKHIVEAHQGRIWAESIEGRGSIFSFSLPVFID